MYNLQPCENAMSISLKIRAAHWLLAAVSSTAVLITASAAPSLSVRKPPVVSGANPNTGPGATDPIAKLGQWFIPVSGGSPQSRSNEFHDNLPNQGGGAMSFKAIYGAATGIVYSAGPGTNIIGFTIKATVTNDTNTWSGAWQVAPNSHGETRPAATATPPYVGTLYRPVIVAEFALGANALFPPGPVAGTPYSVSPGPRIVAVNNDLMAWYCFNNAAPGGNYYVPSWTMPDIPIGASSSVAMQFRVLDGGLTPADPRYAAITSSASTGADLLSNRTTSLKIDNWVESIWQDSAVAYSSRPSDVAVFHVAP